MQFWNTSVRFFFLCARDENVLVDGNMFGISVDIVDRFVFRALPFVFFRLTY